MDKPILGTEENENEYYYPAQGDQFLPAVPSYNRPPVHRPRAPLFIPFTRNSAILQQTVLSYIAAGWPRQDIVIVDNSGTFDANVRGALTADNPFSLPYDVFRGRYGVSILQTPTFLTFSQLQNFILRIALARHWPYYFWGHMDIVVMSKEDVWPYRSVFQRVLEILHDSGATTQEPKRWAVKFFAHDYLTLVNVDAWRTAGLWDYLIPFYSTDCDMYERLKMHGYSLDDVDAGYFWDVAGTVESPERKFFPGDSSVQFALNSERYQLLRYELETLQDLKNNNTQGRNTWQGEQKGGLDQPWTYDPHGFQTAWWKMAYFGRKVYRDKWGTDSCDLVRDGKSLKDAWNWGSLLANIQQ